MSLNWYSQVRASWAIRKNWVHGKTWKTKRPRISGDRCRLHLQRWMPSGNLLLRSCSTNSWPGGARCTFGCMLKAVNLEPMWLFQTFSWNIPRQKKRRQAMLWCCLTLISVHELWSSDPGQSIELTGLGSQVPIFNAIIVTSFRTSFIFKNSHPTIQVPFMPASPCQGQTLKLMGSMSRLDLKKFIRVSWKLACFTLS